MTAAVCLWPLTGRMESYAAIGDTPDLVTRGRSDGVGRRYEAMHERNELWVYPGRVTPAGRFLSDLADVLEGEEVDCMGSDRVRAAEVVQFVTDAGLDWPLVWRGTGASAFAHGSHDVRAFQRMVLDRRLYTVETLLMASAISESELRYDNAGNPALDKTRARSRIDALQAGVICAGLSELWLSEHEGADEEAGLAVFS